MERRESHVTEKKKESEDTPNDKKHIMPDIDGVEVDPQDLVTSVLSSDQRFRQSIYNDKMIEDSLVDPSDRIEPTSHRVMLTIEDPDTEGKTITKRGRFMKE